MALTLNRGGKLLLWLVGCLGFEPRLAITKLFRHLGEATAPEGGGGSAGRAAVCIKLGHGLRLTTEENHSKTSVRARKL